MAPQKRHKIPRKGRQVPKTPAKGAKGAAGNPHALVLYHPPAAPVRTRRDVVSAVCERIEAGDLIADAAKAEGYAYLTIWKWCREDEELGNMYTRARETSAETLEMQALQIALTPNPMPQHFDARLAVDTLKWAAAKRRPKVYNDRYNVEHGLGEGVQELAAAMRAAEKRLADAS